MGTLWMLIPIVGISLEEGILTITPILWYAFLREIANPLSLNFSKIEFGALFNAVNPFCKR